MIEPFDIVGLGCATVDDFLYVDSFPTPDEKTRVLRSERQCGGLTASALVAASRLGARCAYAGVLGRDDLSGFVRDTLDAENVDTSLAEILPDAQPIHSTIVVATDTHTRNIFFEVAGRTGAHDTLPSEGMIRSSRVVFVDHYGMEGTIRACRIARSAGVSVVADLERDEDDRFPELLALVDHLILSERFALKVTGCASAKDAVNALWRSDRRLVAVTIGCDGCWYRSEDNGEPVHAPSFVVDVVDTTGCGDVFHGAYAAALARGLGVSDRIRFATAAAAIKATRPGGQRGIPDRNAVDIFLREHP